jgi:DNA-binding transcriptional MocR family regulator
MKLGDWRREGIPLSESLAAAVSEAVLDGRLRIDEPLPAERRMAAELGVSRGTVTAALALLRDRGWLVTRHGSASRIRLPARMGERYAPLSVERRNDLDLRRAVPAAPRQIYLDAMQRAMDRSTRTLLEDGDPGPGLPELRELVADHLSRQGLATNPDQILITSGARAATGLLIAHLRPTRAAVESPAFFDTLAMLRRFGTRMISVQVTSDGWDEGRLAEAFGEATGGVACMVPDFQNPTGALMDAATRRHVAELAVRHQVTVIADETMRDLDLRPVPTPQARIRGALLVGSLSKTVWAGLRVGWLRAPAAMVRRLVLDPLSAVCSPPPFEQLVACELLPHLDPLLAERRAELRRQRDHLAAGLDGTDAWSFTLPPGGLALWLKLTRLSGEEVARRAAGLGLALFPGPHFSSDHTMTKWLRVPYTAPVEILDRAIARLHETALMP